METREDFAFINKQAHRFFMIEDYASIDLILNKNQTNVASIHL